MNNLLAADIWVNFVSMLLDGWVIVSIIITSLGIAISVLSWPLTKLVYRKKLNTTSVSKNDPLLITLKVIGLALIFIGLAIISASTFGIIGNVSFF